MHEHLPKELNIPHMMEVTERLTAVMAEEVLMLKTMKLKNISQFHDEKMALTAILEEYKKMLIAHPEALKAQNRNHIDQIREQAKALEKVIGEEEFHIQKVRRVHTIILSAIKRSISQQISMSTGYNKQGKLDNGHYYEQYIPPVTVDSNI